MRYKDVFPCFLILLMLLPPFARSNIKTGLSANQSDDHLKFIMMSESMKPTLEVSDIVYVHVTSYSSEIYAQPNNGDIIAFYTYIPNLGPNLWPGMSQKIIVHRAINKTLKWDNYAGKEVWYFTTKGDNNPSEDRWPGTNFDGVPDYYVVGKITAFTRTLVVGTWDEQKRNVTIFSTGTIGSFNFDLPRRVMSFNVIALAHLQNGYACNVTFQKEVFYEPYTVLLDNTQQISTVISNATHVSLYFSSDNIPSKVTITGSATGPPFYQNPTVILIAALVITIILIGAILTVRIRKIGKNNILTQETSK